MTTINTDAIFEAVKPHLDRWLASELDLQILINKHPNDAWLIASVVAKAYQQGALAALLIVMDEMGLEISHPPTGELGTSETPLSSPP